MRDVMAEIFEKLLKEQIKDFEASYQEAIKRRDSVEGISYTSGHEIGLCAGWRDASAQALDFFKKFVVER